MKKMKKIFSSVIAILFMVNNLSVAEAVSANTLPNRVLLDKLATESRLSPLETPELLDVMKLTAGIMYATNGKDLATMERDLATPVKRDAIGDTGNVSLQRAGDTLTYNIRAKQVFDDGRLIVFPCIIEGAKLGSQETSGRTYLCCAKMSDSGSYNFTFYTEKEVGETGISAAMADRSSLERIAKNLRTEQETEATAGVVEKT